MGESQTVVANRRGWRAGLMAGAAGMAALVGVAGTAKWGLSSNLSGLQNKEERVQIVPSFPACSKAGENCISTGCCQVSGHRCFAKGKGRAQCNKTCTAGVKGFTCDVVNPHSVPVATPLGQSLYCFSVYTENTGNDTLVSQLGGVPQRVRTMRQRRLRLEARCMGRGCLRPEVHGSPLRRQGRGLRRGHRRRMQSGQD